MNFIHYIPDYNPTVNYFSLNTQNYYKISSATNSRKYLYRLSPMQAGVLCL